MEKSTEKISLFNRKIILNATRDSFIKLNPFYLIKNPVMFIVEVGAILTTVILIIEFFSGIYSSFNLQISLWLWFTVLFANFAEAVAEGRGRAQSENLRKTRTNSVARKIVGESEVKVSAIELRKGNTVICEAGDLIPADGEVIEGVASVDESAITGESAPVIRESGGDRSAVTGGTKVLSDKIFIKITSNPGDTYIDKMIALVESAKRKKTPNEIALSILLSGLSIDLGEPVVRGLGEARHFGAHAQLEQHLVVGHRGDVGVELLQPVVLAAGQVVVAHLEVAVGAGEHRQGLGGAFGRQVHGLVLALLGGLVLALCELRLAGQVVAFGFEGIALVLGQPAGGRLFGGGALSGADLVGRSP